MLLEETTQVLLLLVRLGRVPLDRAGLALKPIRNEDLVFVVLVRVCQDIRALQGLVEVSEDIVDD